MSAIEARQRVSRLVEAARRIADRRDPLGQRARAILPAATGLSPEGVELALESALETEPAADELDALVGRVTPAPRAHVLLSANVFVAAHRALALALAQSARVEVRPSRREPEMTKLLHEASGGTLFRIVEELAPTPGDHVWAYGSDETIAALRSELPGGIVLHAHGHGFGVAVVAAGHANADAARELARDVALFDQRGCLSPRLVLVLAEATETLGFAQELARALSSIGHDVPRGTLDADESADIVRYRDTMLYAGELLHAGRGFVGLDLRGEHLLLAPVGRNLHVVSTSDLERALSALGSSIAALGCAGPDSLRARLNEICPRVRVSALGAMQRPPLDGPVDLRTPVSGELL